VVTTNYENHSFPRRIAVRIRVSDPLPVDSRTMSPDELTSIVRDSLLALGGQTYMDTYAQDVKAERRARRIHRPTGDER
jgi:hypothetical protein